MKTPSLFSALLLVSTALLFGCRSQENNTSSDAEIRQWLYNFKTAFEAKDTKAIMALYSPDIVAYDIIQPLQYTGADAYTKDWNDYFASYNGPLTLEYRDCHISSSGDLAIVSCLERTTGTKNNGQPETIWLRATSGLRRVNGRWLDFHDHVSVPVDPNTGNARFDLQP